MTSKERDKISKFLSLVLRHKPEEIGLQLDNEGWADTGELLQKINISLADLKEVVETNDKKRFIFSVDMEKIRANQGPFHTS
jgi:putative RNA 2'-phosphotransferase